MHLVLLVNVAMLAAPPPAVEVPQITDAWLERYAKCEPLARPQSPLGDGMAAPKATTVNDAFTDEMASSCGFSSREQYRRFALRFSVALSEAMEAFDESQVNNAQVLKDALPKRELEWKAMVKKGTMKNDQYLAMRAAYQGAIRQFEARQKRNTRRATQPLPYLDAEVVVVGLRRNPVYLATLDRLARQGKLTPAEKKQAVAAFDEEADRSEAWARQQPPLSPGEIDTTRAFLRRQVAEAAKAQGAEPPDPPADPQQQEQPAPPPMGE